MFKFLRFLVKVVLRLVMVVVGLIVLLFAAGAVRYWMWNPDPLATLYEGRAILNMGHRGASGAAPENTIAAFIAAAEQGAHVVELDVMLSGDGEVVVIHDYTLDRTTDGSGLVKEHSLAELKRLDAGSWFSADFAGEKIPTLQEVIDALDPAMLLNIEIKSESPATDGLEKAVVDVIARNNLYGRVLVSSFNPISLLRVKLADRRIPVGLLYMADLPVYLSQGWFIPILLPEALHPSYDLVDEAYMEWAHRKGFKVNVWTVDEAADMERMIDLGVDGIITNRPELLTQILEERT